MEVLEVHWLLGLSSPGRHVSVKSLYSTSETMFPRFPASVELVSVQVLKS